MCKLFHNILIYLTKLTIQIKRNGQYIFCDSNLNKSYKISSTVGIVLLKYRQLKGSKLQVFLNKLSSHKICGFIVHNVIY